MRFGWVLDVILLTVFLLVIRWHGRRPASRFDWLFPWLLGLMFLAFVLLPGYLFRF